MVMLLNNQDKLHYETFLKECSSSTFYHTWAYKNFLESILDNSQRMYFLMKKDDQIVGCLPSFYTETSFGICLNALPFYGSYGAPLVRDDVSPEEKKDIKKTLIHAYLRYACEHCISYNLIDNPFDETLQDVLPFLKEKVTDYRISQISPLPEDGHLSFENLTASFHQKTRNLVRKSLKIGFTLEARDDIIPLYALHQENMEAIQGKAKPTFVFESLLKHHIYKKDYEIFYALKNDVIVAGLLIFYHKNTVEYFTPAIHPLYRQDQPLLFLIYNAMQQAIQRQCAFWNWGGTWASQEGVYHFKKRFGTQEKPYYYYHDQTFPSTISQETLMQHFPFYYVKNFSKDA